MKILFWLGGLMIGLLVIGASGYFLFIDKIPASTSSKKNIVTVSGPTFFLDGINGSTTTLAEAEKLRKKLLTSESGLDVRLMVLPHHTYAIEAINEAWIRLRQGSDPNVIVIVGPNHDDLGVADIQTTDGHWKTPWGDVETDLDLVNSLEVAGAQKTTEVWTRDHSIGIHIPYVAALFPKAKIVPITFRHQASFPEAQAALNALLPQLPADAAFVFSIDFSHFLTAEEARVRDLETWTWLSSQNPDTTTIDSAGANNFDSHASVNMFLLAATKLGCERHVTWYGNSGDMARDAEGPTTSYFIWMCDAKPADSISIQAGGDLMFTRSITSVRERRGAKNFMHDIGLAMYGADLRFANLESVISNQGADSLKEISFRANLEALKSVLAGNFNVLSVSNNHAVDWGRAAWQDSVNRLAEANIVTVGNFSNTETKPVKTQINGKNVIFLGFNSVDRVLSTEMITETVKEASLEDSLVVASFHWGVEYRHQPTEQMRKFAHTAIEAGADLVLGHHPHVLQGFEVYQGKLIAYSLGNLVFDQLIDGTHQSVVARIVIDQNGKGSLELVPMQIDNEWVTRFSQPAVRAKTIANLAGWSFGTLAEDLKDGRTSW